jgi:23S rRNA pseudouridine2605 synthase
MFKHCGRLVEKLKRVQIGFLELGALKPGAYRTLTNVEVERFKKILGMLGEEKTPSKPRAGGPRRPKKTETPSE